MHTLNYDTNGGEHLCHKSIQQTKSLTSMYENEWRIMNVIMCLLLVSSAEWKPNSQDLDI
jgi:hypothetical protein